MTPFRAVRIRAHGTSTLLSHFPDMTMRELTADWPLCNILRSNIEGVNIQNVLFCCVYIGSPYRVVYDGGLT